MTANGEPLGDLRREIDRIDDALLDLLCERVAVVRRIGLVKNDRVTGRLAMRPAREAAILRRLTGRLHGRLPPATVTAIWRELLAATTRLQGPFAVAVHAPEGAGDLRGVTRDHFGCLTPMIRADSAGHALRCLATGAAQLAVLPMPDERETWWRGLVHSDEAGLKIIGRLPFCPSPTTVAVPALIVAAIEPEASGDDITMVALEVALETSRGRLVEALTAAGLPPAWRATVREPGQATALHLFELPGFLGNADPKLAAALAPIGPRISRVARLGAYARPLEDEPTG